MIYFPKWMDVLSVTDNDDTASIILRKANLSTESRCCALLRSLIDHGFMIRCEKKSNPCRGAPAYIYRLTEKGLNVKADIRDIMAIMAWRKN